MVSSSRAYFNVPANENRAWRFGRPYVPREIKSTAY